MLAGGVVDKRLWLLRKHRFFSCRLLVGVPASDGVLKDRQLVVVAAGDGTLKDPLLVAVAAGDGALTDGKHKNLAADAKAWNLRRGRLCGVLQCLARRAPGRQSTLEEACWCSRRGFPRGVR